MSLASTSAPSRTISLLSLLFILRERTVALLAIIFVVLVLVSAYLGYSATSTVNAIYADAVVYLQGIGQPIPPNPVLETSPLGLMRNLSIYVSLIGALVAIVIGYQLIASDRKRGVMPLVGTRPISRADYTLGKLSALVWANGGLMAIAGLIAIATFLVLPDVGLTLAEWGKLFLFFGLSFLYMMLFGLIAMASAAWARSDSVGLLLPVTIWLTITFILPSLTANIHPTAAINPVSALASPPESRFFDWSAFLLGPISVAENFKYLSAALLDYLPATATSRSMLAPLPDLLLVLALSVALAISGISRMDMTRGTYDA